VLRPRALAAAAPPWRLHTSSCVLLCQKSGRVADTLSTEIVPSRPKDRWGGGGGTAPKGTSRSPAATESSDNLPRSIARSSSPPLIGASPSQFLCAICEQGAGEYQSSCRWRSYTIASSEYRSLAIVKQVIMSILDHAEKRLQSDCYSWF